MKKSWKEIIKRWLPLGFVITVFAGLIYGVVQQSYRQSANDPQIQMAEDYTAAILAGTSYKSLIASTSVDISQSLAPYTIIYDTLGTPLAGDGILNGTLPSLPSGVFAYTIAHGEDRFTWQPLPGVRSAVVIDSVDGGAEFVMAGRSLREVESREAALALMTGVAWLIALIGSFAIEALVIFWN